MTAWEEVTTAVGEVVAERLMAVAARGGHLVVGVPVCVSGQVWPERLTDHRADAIWLPEQPPGPPSLGDRVDIAAITRETPVAIVVADGGATRPQVGRVLAQGDLFSRSYPDHGLRRHMVVADEPQEANVAWVYASLGIEVVVADG